MWQTATASVGGFGATATNRDFARFGLLYLSDGAFGARDLFDQGA